MEVPRTSLVARLYDSTVIDMVTSLLNTGAPAPDLSTQKAIPTTSLGPTSLFSSSAMPVISQAATQAKTSATTALNAPPTPPAPPDGITKTSSGTYQLVHNGQIVGTYATQQQAANAGDVLGGSGTPTPTQTQTPPTPNLPQGYTAGTPDAQGNITYTNANGQSVTLPANSSNASTLLQNHANLSTAVQTQLGPGYSVTTDASGTNYIKDPSGNSYSIGPSTAGSADSYSQALTTVGAVKSTVDASTASMNAQLEELQAQHDATLQTLNDQMTTAQEEVRSSYGESVGSTDNASGATAHFQQLIDQENQSYAAQQAAVRSNNQTLIAQAQSTAAGQLNTIEENAKQTTIGLTQQAQTNFLSTAKTFDVSTAQMPAGKSLSSLSIGTNGTTGVPAVDALIQQGIQAGYSPQQSLSLVQAGVATQNKNNQAQFLGLLQQASYANGWANMSSDQLSKDPLFNAYVGMAQSYIPSLSDNPDAAKALVSGGTIQQQKLAITTTGSPSGVSPGLTGGQGGGPIGTIATGTTLDPNYEIPGVQGLTQSAVDRAAQIMNATGRSATAVLGSSFGGSAVAKTNAINALNNRAAQLDPNGLSVVQSQQMLKGAQTTIDTASRLKATVDSAIANVDYSAGLLLGDGSTANPGLIDQVNFGTDVVWNQAQGKYVSKLGAGTSPARQATVGKYLQALNAITYEYGKIVYGSGTATVSSTQDAGDALNGYFSAYSQTQVVNQVLGEIQARQGGIQSVIDGTSQQILDGVTTDSNGNPVMPTVVDPAQYNNQSGGGSTYSGITLPN